MGRMLKALSERALELGPVRDAEQTGNWRAATDDDYVYWLVLDRPGKSVNTIDRSVIEELSHHVDQIIDQRLDIAALQGFGGYLLGDLPEDRVAHLRHLQYGHINISFINNILRSLSRTGQG